MGDIDWSLEGNRCVRLLQELIRIPTINRGTGEPGDGNELPAAELLAEFLRTTDIEPKLFECAPKRTNLVARVSGSGEKPPLLLNAHLDVVEADAARWKRDPFGGEIHEGYVWGRGAIDMKHMAAMSACVLALVARAVRESGLKLSRDVIFAAVSDEEAGCEKGSQFLVNEHPDDIRAEFVLGEIGAFSLHLFGQTFYPIQIAEKGACWVRATAEGEPGHGSVPNPDSAVLRLARALASLGDKRFPFHPTASARLFLERLAAPLPWAQRVALGALATPRAAGFVLDYLIRDPYERRTFSALLTNTASPTIVRAGTKINVISGLATAEIDGRTLPGQSDESFLGELRNILGQDIRLEVLRSMAPIEATSNTPLFDHLARTLKKNDPFAVPVPFIIPGFTDAKAYSRLGATCYGFSPVRFDPEHQVQFSRMYHGNDERIPVEGLHWGLRVLYEAVVGFCAGSEGAPC